MSFLRQSRKVLSSVTHCVSQYLAGSSVAVNTARPTVLSTFSTLCHRLQHPVQALAAQPSHNGQHSALISRSLLQNIRRCEFAPQRSISLEYMHRKGLYKKERRKKNSPLEGRPQLKGVVLKTLIKKPKKPNSANRKCVKLRLSTGKEAIAYVPGEGHNLQEHNIVLVQGGKLQDTPGVKLVCIRGKYDLPLVKKKL
ncbi:40S ribosomal protein S12, mitochondrial isoform X2 [Aplysia californica]|nr:40S ribosomal protein S12, mitochondrial isoform X2 [Aplysia californica]XP_012943426.1 40S ribosomal protein S12, mitochondrial isoform X2 [Aplysia californica]XP_012943427.1 40S ribosomal protein S12, mitochondrial isoform X2 [Aplysia californica]